MWQLIRRFLNPRKGIKTFSRERIIFLPDPILVETGKTLSSYRDKYRNHEGVVYWAGLSIESKVVVTTVIAPFAVTTPGSFQTSARDNADVVSKINDLNLVMIAQVHGHPSSWVDHSEGDDKGAFMPFYGYLSIVVPSYGKRGLKPLEKCGIHEFRPDGKFHRLAKDDIHQRIKVLPMQVDLRK